MIVRDTNSKIKNCHDLEFSYGDGVAHWYGCIPTIYGFVLVSSVEFVKSHATGHTTFQFICGERLHRRVTYIPGSSKRRLIKAAKAFAEEISKKVGIQCP